MAFRLIDVHAAALLRRVFLLGLFTFGLGLGLGTDQARAADLMAGPNGAPMSVEDALLQARDGDTILLLSGEYRSELVVDNRRLSFRGIGAKPPVINGEGKLRQARGLWTIRGGAVELENLEFRGARGADGSTAGVRLEGGKLSLKQVGFYDNEHGVITTSDEQSELRIDGCVFGAAPHVVGGLYHLLNVGRIGKLDITATRFQQGFEGHLIKTRARENNIRYNFIHDGISASASYEIEVAHGGMAFIVGNVIAQGANSRNPVMVAYGTEGKAWDKNELYMAHNTLINYGWTPAWFLRVAAETLPGPVLVEVVNNLLVGPGLLWPWVSPATGHFDGNRYATRGMLRDTATYGFELPAGSTWRGSGVDPRNINGHDLSPKGEFEWPANVRELKPGATQWSPGAFQR